MNFEYLFEYLASEGLAEWAAQLRHRQADWLIHHGDYPRWKKALSKLPPIEEATGVFDRAAVTVEGHCDQQEVLQRALKDLSPWRKGPFQLADIFVNSEWRSDFKWNRVRPHLAPLAGRRILDIGCGNGYHCWRMLADKPELVIGVEPSVLFNLQFQAIQQYLNRDDIHLLPIGVEALPDDMDWFDTVFSMGVLYHRKSPVDHLLKLRSLLKPGGELCLETLVIEGDRGSVLLPEDRYARMRNVWFIPSTEELVAWLRRCGFESVRVVDESVTTIEEQRSTEWMKFESLRECLSSDNSNMTVEGLPAPRRAIILANRSV